ncbi:cytosine deaminase [Radicibacter daui]|uniref:cytosine deaminase n=1 Tax=Radicibacter daui TaxID=3064829 RepID=UPI004046D47E
MIDFVRIPDARRYRLANATAPASCLPAALATSGGAGGLTGIDLIVDGAMIERITPAGGTASEDLPTVDLDRGMVWPAFVDMHTHIDKGHIWPRKPNPDGSFEGALNAVGADREARWSASDVARRMDFSLRCAWAHGTRLLRTHLDSLAPQHGISWPVFSEMRSQWKGRVDLQAACLVPIHFMVDDAFFADILGTVKRHAGVLGAVTFMVPELDAGLDRMMKAATEAGLDLDFHVDETRDPSARSLRHIADAALRNHFTGHITVGHCCSLAMQGEMEAERTMDLVAKAGISVVSLPMCNMYLQDRVAGRTPRWRGITLLHELKQRGVTVAVASDNTRDPFYAYGDLDMVEVFREAVRICHLDHPFGDWPSIVTANPAIMMRRPDCGRLRPGAGADLVLFRARGWSELLARPQADRVVVREGRAIDRTLPDYRELDDLMDVA